MKEKKSYTNTMEYRSVGEDKSLIEQQKGGQPYVSPCIQLVHVKLENQFTLGSGYIRSQGTPEVQDWIEDAEDIDVWL